MKDFYNSPIQAQLKSIQITAGDSIGMAVNRVLHNIQVEINEQELIEVLQADERRYKEAYKEGYEACRKNYERVFKNVYDQIKLFIPREEETEQEEPQG